MSKAVASTLREIERLERLANKHPERSEEFLAWSSAVRSNLELFRELRDETLRYCTTEEICDVAAKGPAEANGCSLDEIGHALALLRRDWGGENACEDEINTLINAVVEAIDRSCHNPVQVLVLGSGMGRMAEELSRRYEHTSAIERLLPMELLRRKMHKRAVSFNIVDPRNRRLRSDIVRAIQIPCQSSSDTSRCDFVIGDARHAPWPDSSFSCVVSAYFSDVIPYSILLPEVTRLLRPGGILVHIGPLNYHHEELGEYLAADQFVARLADFGFSLLQTDWIKTTLRGDPTSMYSHTCDNLVLTARKAEKLKLSPREFDRDAVLGFQEGITLSTEVRMSDESAAILKSELRIGDGKTVMLSPLASRLIEAVDGKTGFGEIVAKLVSMLGSERLPDGELDKLKRTVARLVELGALRLLPQRDNVTGCAPIEQQSYRGKEASAPESALQHE
jgi:SAM-dependent methyltransferase